nr:hypothetical protein B0A51_17649 [Rachicladosporium sp. CCFEE 5018]
MADILLKRNPLVQLILAIENSSIMGSQAAQNGQVKGKSDLKPQSKVHNVDFPSRVKRSTPTGTILLVVLRLADIAWQYMLFSRWGRVPIEAAGGQISSVAQQNTTGAFLGLQPYYFGLLVCAIGASYKQIVWVIFTSEQECPPQAAIMIGVFNTVFNSINALLSLWSWSSAATNDPLGSTAFLLGAGLFGLGIFFEQVSEIQRKSFKSDPKNKGKPYAGGLFSIALNINYGGYTLWRAGYAMVAAGYFWGAFIGVFFFYDFYARALPILDKYCIERYGDAFLEQKRKVPYRIIPGIY